MDEATRMMSDRLVATSFGVFSSDTCLDIQGGVNRAAVIEPWVFAGAILNALEYNKAVVLSIPYSRLVSTRVGKIVAYVSKGADGTGNLTLGVLHGDGSTEWFNHRAEVFVRNIRRRDLATYFYPN